MVFTCPKPGQIISSLNLECVTLSHNHTYPFHIKQNEQLYDLDQWEHGAVECTNPKFREKM